MKKEKYKMFYGWVIVACCFLIAALPMVFISVTFPYYQVPLCNDLGINYVQFSACNVAATIAGIGFSLFLAGKLSKGNTRLWLLLGGAVTALSLIAQSFITSVWQLYLTFFVANLAFCAMTYIPINFLISNWFIDLKGLATSIAFTGSGIGGLAFSGVIAGVIEHSGWRVSFRIAAVVTVITAVIVFLLVRKTPEEIGLKPYRVKLEKRPEVSGQEASALSVWAGATKREAIKSSVFPTCAAVFFCCGLLSAGIMTQLPTYLIEEQINYAAVIAFYSGAAIFAKLVMGPVFDKLGLIVGISVAAGMIVLSQISLLLVPIENGFAYIAAVLLAFGLTLGTLLPPLLTSHLFGGKEFGAIYGLLNVFFMAGCMVGPVLTASIRTTVGSYLTAWYIFIALAALLAAMSAISIKLSNRLHKI